LSVWKVVISRNGWQANKEKYFPVERSCLFIQDEKKMSRGWKFQLGMEINIFFAGFYFFFKSLFFFVFVITKREKYEKYSNLSLIWTKQATQLHQSSVLWYDKDVGIFFFKSMEKRSALGARVRKVFSETVKIVIW
jgi:hypothetical protein